jgi:hypothetical protein
VDTSFVTRSGGGKDNPTVEEMWAALTVIDTSVKKFGIFLLLVALFAVAFVGLRRLHSAQVTEAQGFCQSIIPKLGAARVQTGYYPTNLDVTLLPPQALPALLKGRAFYKSDGRCYSFRFYEPLAMDDIWEYTSSEMRWFNYD